MFRAAVALPNRLWSEFLMWLNPKRELPLRYVKLYPRWDLIEKYGHVSDDDAVANIDSHAAIVFFKTRGYSVYSHPNFIRRLLARHEAILIKKSS